LVNADGSNVTQITNYSQDETVVPHDFYASGSKIIFTQEEDILTINTDGSNLKVLLESAYFPNLNPDKTKIQFYKMGSGWHVADIDGSNVQEILSNINEIHKHLNSPIWSPNGDFLAYLSTYIINLDEPDNVNGIWIVNIED